MGILLKVGIVGGTIAAVVAGLILFRTSITSAFSGAGETVGQSFGGFFGGIGQGITESFSEFTFPSFDFGGDNGGNGASSIAGETVPLGTEGDLVAIPADTIVSEEGVVTSETPPVLIPSQETQDVLEQAQEETQFLGGVLGEFSAQGQLQLLEQAQELGETFFEQSAALQELALQSVGDPALEGSQGIGFFDLPQTEEQEFLPLSQFALDFFESIGVTPTQQFSGGGA